jgi:hypothetical protein
MQRLRVADFVGPQRVAHDERASGDPIAVEELERVLGREPAELLLWARVVGAHPGVHVTLDVLDVVERLPVKLRAELVGDRARVERIAGHA